MKHMNKKILASLLILFVCFACLVCSYSVSAKSVTQSAIEVEESPQETSVSETADPLTREDIDTIVALLLVMCFAICLGVGCLIGHFAIYRIR